MREFFTPSGVVRGDGPDLNESMTYAQYGRWYERTFESDENGNHESVNDGEEDYPR